jgi:hypothetical protein
MKKRNLALLAIGILMVTACQNQESKTSAPQAEQPDSNLRPIGGDKDENGCLIGAGQTWSVLKQGCVQIFTIGKRLNPLEVASDEAVISAFVLFNEDQSKLELFLPDRKETVLIEKGKNEMYQRDSLTYDALNSILFIHNQKRYKGE